MHLLYLLLLPPPTATPIPTDAPTNVPNGPPAGTTNTPDSLLTLNPMATPSDGGDASNPADLSTTDTLGGDPRQSQGGGGNSGGVAAAVVIVLLVLLAIVGATTFLIVFWM